MNMDRLCRVMDAAEDEIDSAFGRSAKLQMKLVEHKSEEVNLQRDGSLTLPFPQASLVLHQQRTWATLTDTYVDIPKNQ
jgi:hypothetical protein